MDSIACGSYLKVSLDVLVIELHVGERVGVVLLDVEGDVGDASLHEASEK